MKKRVGARSRVEVPSAIISDLNKGATETANLVELLVVDFAKLMSTLYPKFSKKMIAPLASVNGLGITKRMFLAGQIILDQHGFSEFTHLKNHRSDVARSWACYLIGNHPEFTLEKRLKLIRPLADDPHFGVREWAWIALRPHIGLCIQSSFELLLPWVKAHSAFLRRYAIEITRPRGVWCSHITDLKKNPRLGLPLLAPLISDSEKYVQDSVSNWLNDAFKSDPKWVKSQCEAWLRQNSGSETMRICKRALRRLA